jgi:DNA-binding response OmpR family regulator
MLEHRPDLMLLDVMLPVQDGFDFLSQLRRTTDVPVIMLTARDEGSSRVLGLRLGADDYIVKPFALDELSARIEAVLRRGGRRSSSTLEFDRLRIDVDARKVTVDGTPLELTAKEFDVLLFLASAPGQVFTRQQLLEQVWGSSSEWQDPRTVTEHVRRLRQKLESAGGDRPWLQTVRGVGYRFDR